MKAFILALLVMAGVVWLYSEQRRPRPAPAVYVLAQEQPPPPPEPPTPPAPPEREAAEGLPVPIYPGTRVSEAEIAPPRVMVRPRPRPGREVQQYFLAKPGRAQAPPIDGMRTVVGQLRGTEARALADARAQVDREVAVMLSPEVPASWKAPAKLIDRLIVRTEVKPVVKEYGTLYEARLDVDLSSPHWAEIRAAYRRELVAHRIMAMAGGLGFALACLASLAGYIRADEATKGYYTNWLRAAAAAGVGASGVLLYQLLA